MAIWQFTLHFIPRQTLLEKYGQVLKQLDFQEAMSISWWSNLNLDLSQILPQLQPFGALQKWTARLDGLRSFGDTEANDISVSFDSISNKVEELSCRLDLRQVDENIIDILLSIATQFDCLLLDSKGVLFEPTVAALVERIHDSNANRFIGNPQQFLDDLSKGVITPEGYELT